MFIAKLKTALYAFAFLMILMASSFMAASEAQARGLKQIPTHGMDYNGQYQVYDIQGDIGDFNYFSNGTAWNAQDLMGRMKYIDKKDVNKNGYQCDWTCKDQRGNTVGLNPNNRMNGK